MTHPDLDRLAAETYVSLTTFRRDGTPVATPVWVTREADRLYVITSATSGKAKRLRHTDRVLVTGCDARGRVHGQPVPGTARLLDPAGTRDVLRRVQARYGLLARILQLRQRLRRHDPGQVGIEITLT